MPQHYRSNDMGLPFSQAVRAGDTLYVSGQLGNRPGTLILAPGGIEGQTRQMMDNVAAILAAHGLSFADVVKCTIMLADMADWQGFNRVYTGYFEKTRLPARAAFGANGLALGAAVEMDAIAVFPPTA